MKNIHDITKNIVERSRETRSAYLERMVAAKGVSRSNVLSCGNLAHGMAGCSEEDKSCLKSGKPNIAIITAYNDLLSAHKPYENFPEIIREAIREIGGTAQVAGGVPAMCDGITQGQIGMELSLFSRDLIAMSTAIALSHNMFDGVLCLGICDKIVPGMLIGSLSFGHLPVIFVPSGPMPSGLSNKEKIHIRQLYAEGTISKEELLDAEIKSYHSAGTCTFYGTANSNQILMEIMGLQLLGSSFVNPYTKLRDEFTRQAAKQVVNLKTPLSEIVDERTIVNGITGLLATGGSTNHTIHLIAIARAAGIIITWNDFAELSEIVPLLTKIYPNGEADINHFHSAGGTTVLIDQLLKGGFLHEDAKTIAGNTIGEWKQNSTFYGNDIIATTEKPFSSNGGLKLLTGNLGRAIIKTSALSEDQYVVEAPAHVFNTQEELIDAFTKNELNKDFIAVVKFQGPKSNGMPELHKLMPALGSLQDKGYKVGLVTDGRLSGASGKVPSAIHITPECASGGLLASIQNGDTILIDAKNGILKCHLEHSKEFHNLSSKEIQYGFGRELFTNMRKSVSTAEEGASV